MEKKKLIFNIKTKRLYPKIYFKKNNYAINRKSFHYHRISNNSKTTNNSTKKN